MRRMTKRLWNSQMQFRGPCQHASWLRFNREEAVNTSIVLLFCCRDDLSYGLSQYPGSVVPLAMFKPLPPPQSRQWRCSFYRQRSCLDPKPKHYRILLNIIKHKIIEETKTKHLPVLSTLYVLNRSLLWRKTRSSQMNLPQMLAEFLPPSSPPHS